MTKRELINALEASPHPDDMEISVYPTEELDIEDLNIIESLDTTMENRLELNVERYK